MLIDTHAHLDDKQFDVDREEVIRRAFEGGVSKIINIGAGMGSSERSVNLAEKYENIFASVGLHPEYFMKHETWDDPRQEILEKLAKNKKVLAIGEIGLDYHNNGQKIVQKEKDAQKVGFVYQLEMAKRNKKPVIIHCRGEKDQDAIVYREVPEAYEDTLEIIQKFPDLRFVFHSYGGSLVFTKKLLEKNNILFSFTGNLTYNKVGSEIFEVVREIPLERIMLETDCPYLAPVPKRGERNEPAYVKFVAEKIAEIRNLSFSQVEEITTKNAFEFFGI
jgi:TatD DNase family protein